jgi:hypothetical protein
MTKCALKLLDPEELMNQDLDVENLYVMSIPSRRAPLIDRELYLIMKVSFETRS